MGQESITGLKYLIYNAALLLTLGIIFDSVVTHSKHDNILTHVLTGLGLGLVVLAVMVNPWQLSHGVVFDTRSILLSLTGMFFGVIPGIIAAFIAIIFRMLQGGAGVYTGCSVIVASLLWGILWKKMHYRWKIPYGFWELYSLGIVTHITMLVLMLFMPSNIWAYVLKSITLPVMIIYPLVTVVLGQLMVRRMQLRKEKVRLEQSESQFRKLYENAPSPYQSLDANGNLIAVNNAWLNALGYQESDVLGKHFTFVLVPEFYQVFNTNFPKFKAAGRTENIEFELLKKDNTKILVSFNGVIVTDLDGHFVQTLCVFSDITEMRKQQKILAESEAKYRSLVDSSYSSIAIFDFEGILHFANSGACESLNLSEAELIGKSMFEIFPPGNAEFQLKILHKVLSTGERIVTESYATVAGKGVWYHTSVSPVFDDNGKPYLAVVSATDITHIKEADLALKESQERFEMFMDNLPGGAFIKDCESRVLFANKYLKGAIAGWQKLGRTPSEIYAEEEATAIVAEDKEVLENGLRHMVENIVHSDGSLHYYDTTKFVLSNPKGNPLIGGITLDVTEQRLAEEQRNSYANRLEILRKLDSIVLETRSFDSVCSAAVENLHNLIPFSLLCVNVLEGEYVRIAALHKPAKGYDYIQSGEQYIPNYEYLDYLTAQKTLVLNESPQSFLPPKMPVARRMIEDGQQSFMYNSMIMQDKMVGFLWFTSDQQGFFTAEHQEIADEFADQLALVLHHLQLIEKIQDHADDLEQRVEVRTNELKEANRELESFTYTVAHDLRSPLRTIDGFCSILMEDHAAQLTQDAMENLKVIIKSTHKMDTLINELLELAKLNRDSLKHTDVDMQSLVEEVCHSVITSKVSQSFDIQIENLPPCRADMALIGQVWQNLLENAVKFTLPKTERSIKIGFEDAATETIYYVQDSGVGFEMKYVNKIFAVFQRLHHEREFQGTGIGLAIVKKIIDRHNGRVWAESTIDVGTKVYFSIPKTRAAVAKNLVQHKKQ